VTALEALTDVQREAVVATATAYLLDPEDLAAQWLPLLLIEEGEPEGLVLSPGAVAVKDELTGDWREIGYTTDESFQFTPDLTDDLPAFTSYQLPRDAWTVYFTTATPT